MAVLFIGIEMESTSTYPPGTGFRDLVRPEFGVLGGIKKAFLISINVASIIQ